ncbi:MAG: hypothetical protein AAF628_11210 [Planctomycetota bacterium]
MQTARCRPVQQATALLALATLALATLGPAQQWTRFDTMEGRRRSAMCFDSARGRIVAFGGDGEAFSPLADTWEWNGTVWTARTGGRTPPSRQGHGMAFDRQRRRVVLFGGFGAPDTTWEWDGIAWGERQSRVRPPVLEGYSMAYDEARGVAVLYFGSTQPVWEWDGVDWRQIDPTNQPSQQHGLVYDVAAGRVVTLDGRQTEGNEIWEWTGGTWNKLPFSSLPLPRDEPLIAYDRARRRLVVWGGRGFNDTWEWDGTQWAERRSATLPPLRWDAMMTHDDERGRTVLFGGGRGMRDTWEWDGTEWTERTRTGASPGYLFGHTMCYDRARDVLVVAGSQTVSTAFQTWEFDGRLWSRRAPTGPSPAARIDHAAAYDAQRGRTVLFGGVQSGGGAPFGDTWEWDGTTWAQVASSGPPAGSQLPLAFDASNGRTLLYSGMGLWAWDGASWTQLPGAAPGPALVWMALCHDERRDVAVLVGERFGTTQTWEYDGAQWTQRSPAASPPRLFYPRMTFDRGRRRCLLVDAGSTATWEWDGVEWRRVPNSGTPGLPRRALGYDDRRQRPVLYGSPETADLYYLTDTPSAVTPYGDSCAGTRGLPLIAAYGAPTTGNASFGVDLLSVRPRSPAVLGVGAAPASVSVGGSCLLLLAPGFGVVPTVTTPAGNAAFDLPIPDLPALRAGSVFVQGLVLDPQGGALGLSWSWGLQLTIGE